MIPPDSAYFGQVVAFPVAKLPLLVALGNLLDTTATHAYTRK
jgi:hypothetical protein